MANQHFLYDVEIRRNSPAYYVAMNSVPMARLLQRKSLEVVRLYQAQVGKKTGRLAASAEAKVRVGGHNRDRLIGVASINDESVQAEWKGKPFYYGVYHEAGTDGAESGGSYDNRGRMYRGGSKRARRRRADGARGPRPGFHELRRAAIQWRGSPSP